MCALSVNSPSKFDMFVYTFCKTGPYSEARIANREYKTQLKFIVVRHKQWWCVHKQFSELGKLNGASANKTNFIGSKLNFHV